MGPKPLLASQSSKINSHKQEKSWCLSDRAVKCSHSGGLLGAECMDPDHISCEHRRKQWGVTQHQASGEPKEAKAQTILATACYESKHLF